MSQLEELKVYTTIVADTADFNLLKSYQPKEATTNPSLVLKAAQKEEYRFFLEKIVSKAKENDEELYNHLIVHFGCEILKTIPGRVSTEVDAHFSFDTKKSIASARHLIELYEREGFDRKRILIKLASTWEGFMAAKVLEKEGISCNMTLLFSLEQAMVAAEVKATLISPFVGRILDWYKSHGVVVNHPEEDPGVLSVRSIYSYLRSIGSNTEVMGASFRNIDEIRQLAGLDLLTISPELLQELKDCNQPLERKLAEGEIKRALRKPAHLNEAAFRFRFNENQMAVEKLSEGIRNFARDGAKLLQFVRERFAK